VCGAGEQFECAALRAGQFTGGRRPGVLFTRRGCAAIGDRFQSRCCNRRHADRLVRAGPFASRHGR
jgi:hypothetical protein